MQGQDTKRNPRHLSNCMTCNDHTTGPEHIENPPSWDFPIEDAILDFSKLDKTKEG